MLEGDLLVSQIAFKMAIKQAYFYFKHHAGISKRVKITHICATHRGIPTVNVLLPPDKSSTLSMPVPLEKGHKVCFFITYYNNANGAIKVRVLKGRDIIHNTELKVSTRKFSNRGCPHLRFQIQQGKGKWQVKRVFFDSIFGPGNFTLEIDGAAENNKMRAIGSIRTCQVNGAAEKLQLF